MSENFLAGQASVWVLPDGPNTKPQYLGCHGVGDLDEPLGDETLLYCPDPAKAGAYIVKNSFTGEPGAITTTIDADLRKTADYLETLGKCGVPIFVHKVLYGRRDVFTNFDRSFALNPAKVTNRGLGGLASRTPGDEAESTQSFDISSQALMRFFQLQANRVSISDTEDITGIAVCGDERCESDSSAAQDIDDYLFAGTRPLAGSATISAEVLSSINGAVWSATAADPFAADEDIQGIVCFRVGRDTIRILVARGTTDGANPAEIAYSDDYGATWTTVNVGSVNGEYCPSNHALFALDRYNIWMGTDGGYIYYSEDAGVSWTAQETGAISATDIVGISFVDTLTGFAVYTGGGVVKTTDGGDTWSAVTTSGSSDAKDIHAISPYFIWVVGADGMFYTHDQGVTWTERNSYAIAAVDFLNELFGVAVGSAASANIYVTYNGGFDWSAITAITNAGYLDVKLIHERLGYVTGISQGGTGMMAKLVPAS